MEISNEAHEFLTFLLNKQKKEAFRIGYNEKNKCCGISKFNITLDDFKDGDIKLQINDLLFVIDEKVNNHLHRLHILYENGKLYLKDSDDQ